MNIDEVREKKTASKEIYKGHILDVYVDDVTLPSGRKTHREVIRHCHASAILAINEKNEVILEEQYRYPYDDVRIELPAGKAEKGEDGLTTAKREFEEETGYQAKEWKKLGTFYPSVAYTDEVIEIYLATGLTFKGQHLDAGEELKYRFVPLKEVKERIKEDKIRDGKTLAGILQYLLLNK